MTKARIMIVDDHKVLRDGLRALFDQQADIEVIGEAPNGRAAVDTVRKLSPHIVIMDVGMPDMNGIEATRRIVTDCPGVRVIALTTYSDRRYVMSMLEAGASAYVLKVAAGQELVAAVRAVMQGKKFLSPEVTSVVLDAQGRGADNDGTAYTVLGAREREVLQLLAEGKTSAQIAAKLHISTKTVDAHRRNIIEKLDLHSVAELTKYAIQQGLTNLDD